MGETLTRSGEIKKSKILKIKKKNVSLYVLEFIRQPLTPNPLPSDGAREKMGDLEAFREQCSDAQIKMAEEI